MGDVGTELLIVLGLLLVNGLLAGSEIALITLRESQVNRLERRSVAGKRLAELARHPNRYLATIQVGITLAGFLASATAAVSLAVPLVPWFGFAGDAAEAVAIVVVTLLLSLVTLVVGELAPKRLALQRAESWALFVAVPLHWAAVIAKPLVWLLSRSTDWVVRLLGGEPERAREEVAVEELRDLVEAHAELSEDHQEVLVGAFEVAERTLRQVVIPRSEVVMIDAESTAADALQVLLEKGHSRAPVAPRRELDATIGIVRLRDLVAANPTSKVTVGIADPIELPESLPVLVGLRRLQEQRQQMALVVDEHGGIEGIVTVEDLIEEVVGEIYDESDRDLTSITRRDDGSVLVPGGFPLHDLVDLGIEVPIGEQTTVAGLVLSRLARIPDSIGDEVVVAGWRFRVAGVTGRRITEVVIEEMTDGSREP